MKIDWKLLDQDGKMLQEVNCQYDSCDISLWDYNAKRIIIDFSTKTTQIIEKEDVNE